VVFSFFRVVYDFVDNRFMLFDNTHISFILSQYALLVSLSMKRKSHHVLSYVIGGLTASCVSVLCYFSNEEEVLRVADRLDRIRDGVCDQSTVIERTLASNVAAQRDLVSPLVITGLLVSWPASLTWSFDNLRTVPLYYNV
jgi:hypothetical protein